MKKSFLILLVVCAGCYYDNEEDLYGITPCEVPTTSTYSQHVRPILTKYCTACHGGTSPSGGINLETVADIKIYVENGTFMGSINQLSGYSPMPKGSGKLSACQIETIQKWIDSGSLNN